MSYADMAERAQDDPAYREGLLAAALVARAQGETCPAAMVAVYVERIADGELP